MNWITVWDRINNGKGQYIFTNRRSFLCDATQEQKRSPDTMGIVVNTYFQTCEQIKIGSVGILGKIETDPDPNCFSFVVEVNPSPFNQNLNYYVMSKGDSSVSG